MNYFKSSWCTLQDNKYLQNIEITTCPLLNDPQKQNILAWGGYIYVGLGYNGDGLGGNNVWTSTRKMSRIKNPCVVYQNMDSLNNLFVESSEKGGYLVSSHPLNGFTYWPNARHANATINILYVDGHAGAKTIKMPGATIYNDGDLPDSLSSVIAGVPWGLPAN